MPWASLSVLDVPSSADLYAAATRTRAARGASRAGFWRPRICAKRARSDACAHVECCPAAEEGVLCGQIGRVRARARTNVARMMSTMLGRHSRGPRFESQLKRAPPGAR